MARARDGVAVPEVKMRLAFPTLALIVLSAPAMAQDRGSFVLDAMTTPGRRLRLGYYLADGLSVRPSLGVGYSRACTAPRSTWAWTCAGRSCLNAG